MVWCIYQSETTGHKQLTVSRDSRFECTHYQRDTHSRSQTDLYTTVHNLQGRPFTSKVLNAHFQCTVALQKSTGPPLSLPFTHGQILR